MDPIARAFAEYFAAWSIRLPAASLRLRRAGYIQKAGWLVQYCFGRDEQGEYLDFYASHHLTNDRHQRIRADGSLEDLPALSTFMFEPKDPAERERVEEEFFRRNREVEQMLVTKGFNRFTVNMALAVDVLEEHLPREKPKRKG